jgi:hypothetical protein
MFDEIKNKVNLARDVDLEEVLTHIGCIKDRFDNNKWHTSKGSISITGQKFMNWTKGIGGGGAIDLFIHLNDCNFKTAVSWLLNNFSYSPSYIQSTRCEEKTSSIGTFRLPKRDDNKLPQIINYLKYARCIPIKFIYFLINSGKLYADNRGNAAFLLLGKRRKKVPVKKTQK